MLFPTPKWLRPLGGNEPPLTTCVTYYPTEADAGRRVVVASQPMTGKFVSDNDQHDDDIANPVTSDDGVRMINVRMINREGTTVRLTAVTQLNGSRRAAGARLSCTCQFIRSS